MESFWKGAFALPSTVQHSLRKSIGKVVWIPLDKMTDADWNWLDWDNLRNTAKNRAARKIMSGVAGLIDVHIERPEDWDEEENDEGIFVLRGGKAKLRYLYLGDNEDEEEFEEDNHDFFGHEPEAEETTPEADEIDNAKEILSFYSREQVRTYLLRYLNGNSPAGRAVRDSSDLSDNNFYLLAAIALGIVSNNRGTTYSAALDNALDAMSGPSTIAAGRGIR